MTIGWQPAEDYLKKKYPTTYGTNTPGMAGDRAWQSPDEFMHGTDSFRYEPPKPLAEENPITRAYNAAKGVGQGITDLFTGASQAPVIGGALQAFGTVLQPVTGLFGLPAIVSSQRARDAYSEAHRTLEGDQPSFFDFPSVARGLNAARDERAGELAQIAESGSVPMPERAQAAFGQFLYGALPNFAPLTPAASRLFRGKPTVEAPRALPAPEPLALPAPRPDTPIPMEGAIAQPTRYTSRGPLISIDDLRPRTQSEFERGLTEAPLEGVFREIDTARTSQRAFEQQMPEAPLRDLTPRVDPEQLAARTGTVTSAQRAVSDDLARQYAERAATRGTTTAPRITMDALRRSVDRADATMRARGLETPVEQPAARPRPFQPVPLRTTTDDTLTSDLAASIRAKGGKVPETYQLGEREQMVHDATEALIRSVKDAQMLRGAAAEKAWSRGTKILDRIVQLGGSLEHVRARVREATGLGPTAGELELKARTARTRQVAGGPGAMGGGASFDRMRASDAYGTTFGATKDLRTRALQFRDLNESLRGLDDEFAKRAGTEGEVAPADDLVDAANRSAARRRPMTMAELIEAGAPREKIIEAREAFFAKLRDIEAPYRVEELGWIAYDAFPDRAQAEAMVRDIREGRGEWRDAKDARVRDMGEGERLRYQIEYRDPTVSAAPHIVDRRTGEFMRAGDRNVRAADLEPGDRYRLGGTEYEVMFKNADGGVTVETYLSPRTRERVDPDEVVRKLNTTDDLAFASREEATARAAELNAGAAPFVEYKGGKIARFGPGTAAEGEVGGPAPKRRFEQSARPDELVSRLEDEGGFSYDMVRDEFPSKGYAVSPFKEREVVHPYEKGKTLDQVFNYADANADILTQEDAVFGGWVEDGKVYFDVSILAETPEKAGEIAKAHGQRAYFDLAKKETVYVGAEDVRADPAQRDTGGAQAAPSGVRAPAGGASGAPAPGAGRPLTREDLARIRAERRADRVGAEAPRPTAGSVPPSSPPPPTRVTMDDLRPKQPAKTSLGREVYESIRSLKSFIDLPLGRQGIRVIGNPVAFAKGAVESLKAYKRGPEYAKQWLAQRQKDPLWKTVVDDMGVELTDPTAGSVVGQLGREEFFPGGAIEKTPLLGGAIQHSNAAYSHSLNVMRWEKAKSDLRTAEFLWKNLLRKSGPLPDGELKALGRIVNVSTGRGQLGKFSAVGDALGSAFFSPRNTVSWPQFFLDWAKHAREGNTAAAMVHAKTLVSWLAFSVAAVKAYEMLSGEKQEYNWRSADFLKVKSGDRRMDIMGGGQQWLTLLGRASSGERKSTAGEVSKVTIGELLGDFITNRSHPALTTSIKAGRLGADMLNRAVEGKEFTGTAQDPFTEAKSEFGAAELALGAVAPIIGEQFIDALRFEMEVDRAALEEALKTAAEDFVLAFPGFGVDRYRAGAKVPPIGGRITQESLRPSRSAPPPARTPSPFRTPAVGR